MQRKPRVVHLLPSLSPYVASAEWEPPAYRWETGTGSWVGIYDQHWSDLLCRAILRVTSAFDLEVWQPDLRADQVYAHTFDDGLKHVLFPAICKGLTGNEFAVDPAGLESSALLAAIDGLESGTILHLNELLNPLTESVPRRWHLNHVPVVLQQHGGATYLSMARHGKRVWRRVGYLLKSLEQRRLCRQIDHAVVQTRKSLEDLRTVYSGPIGISTMGLDFEYWQPGDKQTARGLLDLPSDRLVLLTASLLRPKKQLDKLIRVLLEMDQRGFDFIYLVVGGGEPGHEATLRRLGEPLAASGKIRFLGRVPDDVLLRAYHAADLFLSVSSGEGGPVAVMKAFACGVPVFTTDVGHVAEFMREMRAEVVVPDSPRVWGERLARILAGETEPVVSRDAARQTYDWPVIGQRFALIYQEVLAKHGIPVDLV